LFDALTMDQKSLEDRASADGRGELMADPVEVASRLTRQTMRVLPSVIGNETKSPFQL
jgi:hypothetical protein